MIRHDSGDEPPSDKRFVVLKFGGTSVKNRACWDNIGGIVQEHMDDGALPVVVCSAVGGVTDLLVRIVNTVAEGRRPDLRDIRGRHEQLARDLEVDLDERFEEVWDQLESACSARSCTPRREARIMATGELLSTSLGVQYLRRIGLSAHWEDARSWLRTAPGCGNDALSADVDFSPDPAMQTAIAGIGPDCVVTQGFICSTPGGLTSLLGRGGSDTSAACFAAKLQADKLEIWTDVPGLFTANPRVVPAARLIRHMSYDEAEALAAAGGSVLHARTISPLRGDAIPLEVRSTHAPDVVGTHIGSDDDVTPGVKAVSGRSEVTMLSLRRPSRWQPVGFLAEVAGTFAKHGLSIDLVSSSPSEVRVAVDNKAYPLLQDKLPALVEDLGRHSELEVIGETGAVAVVGHQLRKSLGTLPLRALDGRELHMVTQAANDLSLSFVVDGDQTSALVQELHRSLLEGPVSADCFGDRWVDMQGEQPRAAAR